jgi:hypothetical protein
MCSGEEYCELPKSLGITLYEGIEQIDGADVIITKATHARSHTARLRPLLIASSSTLGRSPTNTFKRLHRRNARANELLSQRESNSFAAARDAVLRLDNFIADGVSHQLANGMAIQPPHDIRAVRFSGLHT